MNLENIEEFIKRECSGDVEVYDVSAIKVGQKNGLRFDLFDHLNKEVGFEQAIEELLYVLDKKLPEKFIFSHYYSDEKTIADIDGKEYPDYHCYLKIWEVEQ